MHKLKMTKAITLTDQHFHFAMQFWLSSIACLHLFPLIGVNPQTLLITFCTEHMHTTPTRTQLLNPAQPHTEFLNLGQSTFKSLAHTKLGPTKVNLSPI